MNNKSYGTAGEIEAVKYLKKNKYKVIQTNYICKVGEIDIIAQKDDVVVFVEVKSRSTKKFGLPREAVTTYKQNKIRSVASYYLMETAGFDSKCRFDVIEILDGEINHISNAF